MYRLCQLVLAVVLSVSVTRTARPQSPPPQPVEQRNPEELIRNACARLVALDDKHDLLAGASAVEPVITRDDEGRLKGAHFVFERNAMPFGKGGAKPKDQSKPFIYVSVQVWSGRTPSPPGDLHEFEWRGQAYQMWVRVIASDAELVQTIRKAVDEPLRAPPVLSFYLDLNQA